MACTVVSTMIETCFEVVIPQMSPPVASHLQLGYEKDACELPPLPLSMRHIHIAKAGS
jgi:hypothetical protein